MEEKTIPKNRKLLSNYKVAMASAYPKKTLVSGNPTLDNIHQKAQELIELFPPGTAFGRSKMLIFNSANKKEAENFIKYTQTRFFAYMVLNEPNRSFSFGFVIPILNFKETSDIDWTKPVSNIDKQIYKKFKLTSKEIRFIEQHQ